MICSSHAALSSSRSSSHLFYLRSFSILIGRVFGAEVNRSVEVLTRHLTLSNAHISGRHASVNKTNKTFIRVTESAEANIFMELPAEIRDTPTENRRSLKNFVLRAFAVNLQKLAQCYLMITK